MNDDILQVSRTSGYVPVASDVELFFRTVGEGDQTVVLLHGGPGFTLEYFLPDVQPLARNRRLLLYDQRSSGRSTLVEDPSRNTISDMVEDLEQLRQHFELESFVILGHSWGSQLAGLYAIEYPSHVERMVLVGSAGPSPDTWVDEFNPADRLRPELRHVVEQHQQAFAENPGSRSACWDYWAILGRGFHSTPKNARRIWGDLCERPPDRIRSSQPGEGIGIPGNEPDFRDELAAIDAPMLVVHCEDGPIAMSAPEAWVEALPNAALFSMPTGGHLPWIDRPEVFFPAVDLFLRGTWPDPPGSDGAWERPADFEPDPPEPNTHEALVAEIEEAAEAYAGALTAGDWERAAACFTEDGMLLGPAAPPVSGHRAIAAYWEIAYERGFREVQLQTIEVEGFADRALELGKYVVWGDEEVMLDTGKYMAHWRDVEDGWRLYRDIYNSSLDTPSPLETPHYLPPPEGTFGVDSP